MHARIPRCASALPVVFLLAATACNDGSGTSVRIGSITAPSPIGSASVIAAPPSVVPNFVANPFCRNLSPFNLQFMLTIRSGQNVFIRVATFELIDRFGARTLPTSISTTAVPNTLPVSIPSSLPIPIPGSLPLNGMFVTPRNAQTLPLFLQFGCGATPAGMLNIGVETADSEGTSAVSRISVRIGA